MFIISFSAAFCRAFLLIFSRSSRSPRKADNEKRMARSGAAISSQSVVEVDENDFPAQKAQRVEVDWRGLKQQGGALCVNREIIERKTAARKK
jgi:hypothetical protein